MGVISPKEIIYPLIPQRQKNAVKHIVASLRRLGDSRNRMQPDFLIIGAQKCGTSSLFKYLIRHGGYLRPLLKDIYYFDRYYNKGPSWYLSFFPSLSEKAEQESKTGERVISGEGATYYLLHPLAPERVHSAYPNMKLIVLLRDPAKRALSHYHHNRRFKHEPLESALEALRAEEERLDGEFEKLVRDPDYHSPNFQNFSYLARGRYAEQLRRWFKYFPREQFLILNSERFYKDTDACFKEVCRFLDIEERSLPEYRAEGQGKTKKPAGDEEALRFAVEHFRKPNEELFELLGQRFDWLR